jgi:hypothetical protein
VYYLNGLENANANDSGVGYYAVAGTVTFDLSGNAFPDANGNCGEQDYNDGYAIMSAGEPTTPDTITATGSSMVVNSTTGTAILTLVSSNTEVGAAGTETFAVQWANASHGIISQFDGSATSSGGIDLQSAQAGSSPGYAFTLSGVDSEYDPVAYGGVFADASGAITGTADVTDDGTATPAPAAGNMTGTDNGVPATDFYGRGTASVAFNGGTAISVAYYVVGPEVLRIIDVDTTDSAVGSAYGQGATPAFDSTALGTADVFGILGNPWGASYAASGNIVPVGAAAGTYTATFTGEGDVDEAGDVTATASATGGNYAFDSSGDGYGSMTSITGLGDLTTFGVYATDPALNLYDPNNTTSGQGGALVLEMDSAFPAATGIIVPQGTIAATDFAGNSYGFGAQTYVVITALDGWEYDYVAQGSWDTTFDLTGGGLISDPFGYFVSGTAGEYGTTTPIPIAGTAVTPDAAGRYAFPAAGTAGNFAIGPVGTNPAANAFTYVLYEASGGFAFAMDSDTFAVGLGTLEEQSASSLKAMHFKRGALPKAQAKRKR